MMWAHDNGIQQGLPPNFLATAVACAWRGMDITYDSTYFLPGRVIVTGQDSYGELVTLEDLLAVQAHAVADAVRDALMAGNASWSEVLQLASTALARDESAS
ncbi:hypothetical protein LN042_23130 [Kitasatospora sp. RB6PN24]|uniref:hypothetical protein n=1 Tax=Kitasatospora humi TaxID=2893891 RepID=UPI001E5D1FAC|nr:hypothetical protein [Kitasatospora humi]MCC9309930.1 hypothetical protein [Kitasatospora humi]